MKKNLLLTTLLLATTLTFTACGKAEEVPAEESTVAVEETVEEESETETVVEESTEEAETLAMTEEEIIAFLEEVRDMDYESYTYRSANYFTDVVDVEGNQLDDSTYEDLFCSTDNEGNIFFEEKQLKEGAAKNGVVHDFVDDTYAKYYFLINDTYATNNLSLSDTHNWTDSRETVQEYYVNYAPFFKGWSDLTVEGLAVKAVVSEYNNRPVLYLQNMTNDTEDSLLQTVYPDATKYTAVEGSLCYDTYLYLDALGEYVSTESFSYTDTETGTTYTEHWDYELSNVNSTELPEVPENFIKY